MVRRGASKVDKAKQLNTSLELGHRRNPLMTTQLTKTEIVYQFLIRLRTRNWDSLKSIMADDIVWNLPGSSPISGEAQGVDAVIERSQLIVSHGLIFTLKQILNGRHGVLLSLNNTARRGDLATVLSIRDGKISAIDTYMSVVDMLNAFFVAPRYFVWIAWSGNS
jgi:uncharacterized protein